MNKRQITFYCILLSTLFCCTVFANATCTGSNGKLQISVMAGVGLGTAVTILGKVPGATYYKLEVYDKNNTIIHRAELQASRSDLVFLNVPKCKNIKVYARQKLPNADNILDFITTCSCP